MASELGIFLQTRRKKIDRSLLKLSYPRHITKSIGAKREEIALLAGISGDYYAHIEQGRILKPSMRVIDALSDVLCLTETERKHVYRLAEIGYTPKKQNLNEDYCPESLQKLVHSLNAPAYIVNNLNDILCANESALALYYGIDRWPEEQRNTTRYFFLDPAARALFTYWEETAEISTAYLRHQLSLYPDDQRLVDLIGELRKNSEDFRGMWKSRDVYAMSGGNKYFTHPYAGQFTLRYDTLLIENTRNSLVVFSAGDDPADEEAIALLRARESSLSLS